MKECKLIQDAGNKLRVSINEGDLSRELVRYFGWRKNSKDINYNISRFRKLGTSDYDKFIEHIYNKGYNES